MVMDSRQFYCLCLGYLVSFFPVGQKRYPPKPTIFEYFYRSLFIFTQPPDRNERSFFHRYGNVCHFSFVSVDPCCRLSTHGNRKKICRFRNNLFICHSVFADYQRNPVKNDCGTFSGSMGCHGYLFPVDRRVYFFYAGQVTEGAAAGAIEKNLRPCYSYSTATIYTRRFSYV